MVQVVRFVPMRSKLKDLPADCLNFFRCVESMMFSAITTRFHTTVGMASILVL